MRRVRRRFRHARRDDAAHRRQRNLGVGQIASVDDDALLAEARRTKAGCGTPPPAMAASTSALTTRPRGPVPRRLAISSLALRASRRASGLAKTRAPSLRGG